MKLRQLINSIGYYKSGSFPQDFEVKGLSCNSNKVSTGYIFVAIKGVNEDGHNFIAQAIKNGARVVILEETQAKKYKSRSGISFICVKDTRKTLAKLAAEFYAHPSEKMKVIGVTGTNGKTTITYLLEAILKKSGFYPAVIGTINYRFKDRIFISKNTTPGPVELQSLLADMAVEGIDYAIMEVSSHALDQERTDGVNFSSAIFTNLTQDHLDYHKNLTKYFQAKAKLFQKLTLDSFAIVNNDDAYARKLKKLTSAQIFTYGINRKADVVAKEIKFYISHTRFRLIASEKEIDFISPLIGAHNVYNILAASAWSLKEGLNLAVIRSAIAQFATVPGRLERISFKGNFYVFVDYAHTEDALRNVVRTLRHLTSRRIIVIFGCGGDRDKTKRPKMGRAVTQLADYAIITNDNPRREDPAEIIAGIKKGIDKENYAVVFDRRQAIRRAISLAKRGDIVLIAGKGHENCQILKDKVVPFDDRQVARECLRSLNY